MDADGLTFDFLLCKKVESVGLFAEVRISWKKGHASLLEMLDKWWGTESLSDSVISFGDIAVLTMAVSTSRFCTRDLHLPYGEHKARFESRFEPDSSAFLYDNGKWNFYSAGTSGSYYNGSGGNGRNILVR